MSSRFLPKSLSIVLVTVVAAGLAGCGLGGNLVTPLTQSTASQTGSTSGTTGSGTTANVAPGYISGLARGGQQPIANGTVTLWAAGTSSGYGAGATKVGASTTTDSNGMFNLNVGATGSTPQCVNGQLNYITVTKGNPGGGANNASALMVALPTPCNTVTGYPGNIFVQVNEATTVAAVWALQQFMSVTPSFGPYTGSGTPPWNIGAPATNQTGLANAFNNASQLVNIATGTSATYTLTNTVTYPVASANGATYNATAGTVVYTSTIQPDNSRVNLVADILSSCVNSTAAIPITGWAMNSAGTVATFYTPTNLGAAPGTTVLLSGFSSGTFLNTQTATVSSSMTGSITALNITNPGSGYTSPPPTVTISAPPSGTTATATAVVTGGVVTSFTITNPGSGYTTLPTVTIAAPTSGITAAAVAQSGGFTAAVSGGTANASNLSDSGTATVTTGSGTSSTCANLFADVVPTTAVLPTDTIQAAYDVATAPAGITEYAEAAIGGGNVAAGANVAPSSLYNSGTCTSGVQECEWALAMCDSFVTGTPPFVPLTACTQGVTGTPTPSYPTDFAIGVRWSALDSALTPLTYGIKNGSVAIDSNGNVWTGYTGTSSGTGYPIIEWSPSGQVLQVLGANGIVSGANTSATYTMPATTNVVLNTTSNVESSSSTQFNYGTVPTVQVLPGSYVSSAVYSIAVDTANHAWVTDSLAGTVGTGITGFFPGVVFQIAPATGWSYTSGTPSTTSTAGQVTPYITGFASGAIAIDGSNNLWMATEATTGSTSGNLTLIPAAGGYNTIYEGQYVASHIINQVAIDGNGIAIGFLNENTTPGEPVFRNSVTTAETPASLTSLNLLGTNYTSSPALIPEFGALDASNNIWMGEWKYGTGQIAYFGVPAGGGATTSVTHLNASSALTTYVNNNYFAGLQSPAALSIDGLGNVFILNGVGATASGVSELTSTGTQLTPTNAGAGMPAYGLNIYSTDAGRAGAIDQSGNFWTGTGSNSYEVHMVGLAAPVTTPLATQVGTNKIGQRP